MKAPFEIAASLGVVPVIAIDRASDAVAREIREIGK
jgi:hypothetical protein